MTMNQSTWTGWPVFGYCTSTDPAATAPGAHAALAAERFHIVSVRYLDAACGGEERTVRYDHSAMLPRGQEPTTCIRDITDRGPITFGEACVVAEENVIPWPVEEEAL